MKRKSAGGILVMVFIVACNQPEASTTGETVIKDSVKQAAEGWLASSSHAAEQIKNSPGETDTCKMVLIKGGKFSMGSPTHPEFRITGTGDLQAEKVKWIEFIEAYAQFSETYYVHWFFGKMTKEQLGYLAYKHTDHHLRQFNC